MIQARLFRIENAKRPLAVLTLLVLLAALAALGQPRDARAQSPPEDVVLVSNVDQTAGDELTTQTGRSSYAQSFTTGDHPDGYFLSSVDLGLSLAEGAEVKVELWRSYNSSHTPSVAIPRYYLMTLSGPASVDDDTSTLERFSTNDVVLLPNWDYWIVVTRDGGADEGLTLASTSTQDALDPGGISGFELRESLFLVDSHHKEIELGQVTSGFVKETELDPRIKIKLRGSEATRPPGPYFSNRNLSHWGAEAEIGDSITRYANSFTPNHFPLIFRPGTNVDSYEMTSVTLSVAAAAGISPRVSIHADDGGRPSASPIPNGTLTSPSTLSQDLRAPVRAEFAASPALNLSKGTKYWVVIEANPGSGRLSIGTVVDNESGVKPHEGAWGLGYQMQSWGGSSWTNDGQGRAFRMSLNGTTDLLPGLLYVGSPQVGMGVTADIDDELQDHISRVQDESWQWQRGDSKDGQFTDIPAEEGGTSGVYTPSASDLGKWLKATVTYNDGFAPGRTASAVANDPVQLQPVASNASSQHPYLTDGYHLGADLVNIAQAFTTGDKASGYIFGGLRVGLSIDTNRNLLSWALYPDDGGHPAGTPLFASVAVPPEGLDLDVKTLEELLHPGHRLEPGTKYWAVLTASSRGQTRVQFESATYAVDEGGEVEVTLSLTEEHDEALTVPILASGLGGADIDDYDGVPDSVTFEPGETSVSFRIGATDDDEAEVGERLQLSLGEMPVGVFPGGPAQTIVYINEAGQAPAQGPTLRFGAPTYRVVEGETVEVTVVLSQPLANDLVVPIVATGQGGASPSDFTVSSSITVGAGETEQRFTFAATGGELYVYEGFESVILGFGELGGAVSAASRHAAQTTVIIADAFEGRLYEPTLGVSAINEWGDERILYGPSGELDQGSEPGWSFDYMTLAKADSASTEWIPFSVATEVFGKTVLRMSVLTYPQVTATFGQAEYEVAEGGSVEVTVSLSEDPQRSVTIPLSATGQDEADATDFEVPESITFDAGEQSKTVTISALQDEIDDDDETIRLTFGATLPDGVTAGSPDRATVSIIDDDDPPVTVRFEQSAYEVDEGGSVVVAVTLSAAPEREVEIPLTGSPQGETDSGDFSGVPASLTFNADQTSRTFTFSATDDLLDDDGDSVLLGFGATLPDGVTAGSPDRATVSIIDDDHPPVTVRFEQSAYEVDEGGSVVVAVTLSAAPEREVEIPLTGSPQGETDSGDFSGVPASLTFNADQTSRTFTFSANDDLLDDDGDSVLLGFGATLPDGVTAGSPDRATVSITDDDDPPVTVRFEQSAYEVDEGGSVVVAVTLSAAPEREVEIPLTGSPQGETDSGDFSGVPASLTFNADQTSRTFTFSATDDLLDDDGDSVLLTFGATLPDGVTAGSPDRATVSIIDDDHPPVTVRFEQSAYEVDEGGSVVVAVTLSAAPEREVEIPLTGSPQGETDSGDFSGVPASLTFNADQTSRTFTFSATDDLLDDDGDSVLLGFGSTLPDGVTAGSPDRATVSITDDDDPPVTVRFEQSAYAVDEGGTVVVAVTLSAAPEREVEIPLTGSPQGETDSGDFSGVPASLTFNADQTSRTFTFSATDDLLDDDGDSVLLTFGATLPDGVTAGSPDRATVSIIDDDDPPVTVRFEQSAYAVDEGGSVVVAVTLSAAPEREVEIPLTGSPQGETDSGDFSGVPASLTFNADQTSRTFTFSATDDLLDDDGDSVLLGFGATLPDGVTAGSPDRATVSITDDDHPPVTVRFEQSAYAVDEGGTVVVAVTLSAAPEREVEIPLTGSPQGETDSGDFSGVPASLTFNADQTSRTFTFSATDDLLDDDGDSVLLGFGATLPDGVTAGSPDRATVSITDDDHPPVTVRFEQSAYAVDEGGTVVVAVTLSAAPEREVEIPLTGSPQGETDSNDFSGVPASLTFNADQTSRTFTFSATPDSIDDDGDSVLLGFGATLPDGVTAGSPDQATVSIIDDDRPDSLTVRFQTANYSIIEGDSRTITVLLDDDPERSVVIPIRAEHEGGANPSDYSDLPASLTFNSGQTSRSFQLRAVEDQLIESGEQLRLRFDQLPPDVSAGDPAVALATLHDRTQGQNLPSPPTIHFAQASYTVAEGATLQITVTLSKAPGSEVEITLTGSPQGETTAADFSIPASLTFGPAETSKTLTFAATPDSIDDDGDSVLLSFSNLPAGITTTPGSPDQATVSIIDDDDPPVTVRFEQSAYAVDEGGTVVVAVTLSAAPEREVEIPLTGSPQGETDSNDFSGVPASLTFNADQTSRTFTFSATDDLLDDDGDSVLLGFGATLPDGVTAGSPDRATVSITDDDHPPVTVRFEQSAYAVDEGGSVVVAVTLSAAPEREVEIPLTGSPQGETDSGDFSGVPASLTFNADQTSRTFTFSATDDLLDDDGDSVLLGFGATLPDGVTAGSPDRATVSITDDDHPPVTVRFEQSAYAVDEGGTVVVAVTLSAAPEREVEIPLTGSPQGETDSGDFSGVPASLTFNADQTSRTFTFSATDDLLDDDGDSVLLGFGATLPDGVTAGSPDRATVSITDDDHPPVTVRFEQSAYAVDEGGTVVVAVTLSAAPEREVEIPLTGSPQGETDSNDFSGVPASLTFNADQTSRTFTFSATPDSIDDDGDSVLLGFGATLPDGVTAGSPDQATVSIIDDDRPDSLTVRFQTANYSIIEGDSRTITVLLDDDPERSVVIPIRAEHEGGANPSDYSDLPASLTFNSGQTSRSFQLRAVEDQLIESGEQLRLRFDQLPPDVSAGDPAVALATLHDRTQGQNLPSPPTIHFAQASYTVAEGATLQITVTLSKAPGSEVEITLTGSPQGETTAADFSIPASLTFGPAETSKTLTFAATPDSIDDDGDSVLLSFSNLPAGITTTPGSPDQATVSIIDDDDPPVTVRFEQSAYAVDEGGSVVVAVTLSAAPEREVEIPLTGSPQGETDSGDFSGVPASLTFNADQTSRTFTFSATDDLLDDDGDSVLLTFGSTLPDGVTAGSPDRATVSIIDDDDPPVTVRFEQSAYAVDEGGSVVVAVTLSAAPEREVEIPLTGSPQGETDSNDFSGVPASLTFNADQTSRTFTFSATPDSIDDDGDSVLLGFGATLPDGVTAGSPDRATVSITDDDDPPVTVRFEQSAYAVDEGGTVVVAVTLSAAPEREVEIPLTGSPQGETDSNDFSGVPASLTFNADQTSRTFTFSATPDSIDDDGDSVLLGFGATLPDGVTAGSPDRATVSINDDDDPPVTVRFEQSAYAVDEGGSVVVAVTLSAAPEREVEIPLTGSPQGETDSNDFSGVPASLTFNADQTSRTFTFSATPDSIDDDGDSVLLGFGATLPDGVTAGSPDRATVSINDDDDPPVTVRFEQSAYAVDEGGSVVVAVTLSAAPEREVEIPLTGSPQGETDSNDFSGVPASLTFNADQTSRTFTFSATDDLLDDDGDSVLLGFGATLPDGVTAGSPDQATVSIIDDDRPDSLTVRFQTANYSIIEGDSRTITVLLDDDPERSVVIPIRAEHEGGANPSDYSDLPASLTFNSGQTSRSFQLRAVEDQLIESGEQLRLRFDQLPPDVSAGDPAVALATLHDRTQGQNLPSPPTIHFAQASYTVAEGATLQITVTLSKAPGSEVEITLTGSPQGETTAADFSIPASLTFGPAETSKTLTFAATPDSIDDDGDSVLLSFSNLPAGITTTPGSPDQATVSIIDDDDPPVTVRFEQSAYAVDEGGTVVVAVTLSAAPEREVEIPLTGSPQGETDSNDFSGVPASLTFNADQTSRTFTFSATDDLLDDDGDSVLLGFGATLPDGVTAGSPDRATVSITDDDHPPVTVRFEQSAYAVDEGGSVVVAVTLSAAPEREVEIPLTGSPQGETDSNDFSGVPASLTFNADQTSRTFTFSATDDLLDDDGDSVLLGFGATLPDGVTAGSPDRATVSITDDDHPPVTVRFEQSAYAVDEGGSVVVAVTLSAAPEREVEIPLTGSPQGETDSGDFSGVPASLTFNADQTSRTFTFSATDDLLDDDGDSVLLGFGATLPDGVTAGSPDRATVSIIDDDDPPVTVRFEQSAYAVDEGGSVVVAVTLSAAPEREVEIPLTGSPQGETDSGDFSGVPASLTFNADQTSRTFTFSATDDLLDDDGDSVLLTFGSTLPDGVTAGSPDRATVSIIDDDDPPVTVRFEQSAYAVDEGGTVVVAVTLSAAPEREVEIPLTGSPQGETDSNDFSGVPASLTFNADQTSRTFTFSATPDSIDDDGDSVLLGFGATLPDGVTAGSPDRATVSINDDDDPPVTVRFEQSAYAVDEGGSVVVAVTLSAAPEREVEIPLTGSPQGETDSGDFSGVPASLTFNADQTSRTFTFSATDDLLDDDGDSVLLTFGSTLPDGVTAGSPDRATVSIIDDDDPPVTVRFEQSAYAVDEGGSVVVAVTLSAAPEREVEIPLTGSPQGETDSNDFSGVPASLTFNADQTSRTFTFSATPDSIDDDGDSVLLTFGSTLPDGVTAGSPDQATVSITDDDDPPVTVSFATSVYQVPEGGSVAVTVILSEEPERSVAIPLTTTHLGSAGLEDYSGVPANLTFHSGETTRSFNVSAHEDDVNDEGESIRLGFEMLPSGVSEGPTSSTTIAITQPAVWVDGTLRLVNGETFTADGRPCDGRLEIFIDGSWGTICDDYWTKENADVACRALGFAAGSVDNVLRFSSARFGRGSGDIVLDDVSCSGNEFGMLDCPRRGNIAVGTHNCRHSEDVGVRCLKEAPPRVVNIEVSEPPGDNGRYDAGETVEITLIWNVPVKVTTPQGGLEPKVWIVFDDGMQTLATYSRGSGTYRTVFVHRLTYLNRDGLPNESYETVRVVADTLQERGGSIRSVGLGLPPVLQHLGYPEIRDTAAPATIVTPPQFNDAGADATWSVGDTIEVTFNFNFPVVVDTADGTPFATILLGGDTLRQSTYLRGSGTNQLVFAYALTESDGTHDVLIVQPNVLMLNGGTIRDQIFNLDASLVHWHAAQIASAQTLGPGSTSAPLTASIENDPGSHDGSSAFTFELHFSEEVQLSSATLRNAAFSVSGGQVTNAQPQSEASTRWTVTVQPTGNESVTITLPATTDCTSAGAVCTSDGRPLVAPVQLVVPRSFALQFFQANSPATGAPEIVGTPQVEQTLTAQTTGITDDDGMEDATIAYQWMRHNPDSLSDEEISGATVVTYTVTAQDRGSALRVRTTFTDDAGNHESLTSLPTAMIPRLPLTATIVNASPTHDGHSVYTFELRLSEDLVSDFSFRTLRDYAFLVSGGDVTRARRLDRPGNMRWEISIQPDSDGELYITLPSTTDCAYLNALCTPDGRRQSSRLELIVPGPNGN